MNHDPKPLDKRRLKQLEIYETEMEKRAESWVAFGRMLATIKQEQLYLLTHKSWADYCENRWGHRRQWGYRAIKAYEEDALPVLPKPDPQTKPGAPHLRTKAYPNDTLITHLNTDEGGLESAVIDVPTPEVPPPKLPKDCTQTDLSSEVADAIREGNLLFGTLIRACQHLRRQMKDLAQNPLAAHFPYETARIAILNATNALKDGQPWAPCPYCRQGLTHENCEACKQSPGWIARGKWENSPKDMR